MQKVIFLFVLILIGFSAKYANAQNKPSPDSQFSPNSKFGAKPSNTVSKAVDRQKSDKYNEGILTVKLKQGISPILSRQGSSSVPTLMGIPSLDAKLSQMKIEGIQKSFEGSQVPVALMQRRGRSANISTLPDLSRYYYIRFSKDISIWKMINDLKKDPNVELAEPVPVMNTNAVPNDAYYNVMQHLPQIQAEQAWNIHKGQNGSVPVLIGICDSGVEWFHPDLFNNLYINNAEYTNQGVPLFIDNQDGSKSINPAAIDGQDNDGNGKSDNVIGWNFTAPYDGTQSGNPLASTVNIHGTHVAGLAAAVTDNTTGISSISWNVKFLPSKHGLNTGGTSIYFGYDGIVYLAEMGCDIINCSWGGSGFSQLAEDAVAYVTQLGSILMVSAGNNNNALVQYPTGYPGAVGVASVASNDVRAYYLTYGISADVSAPGGDIYVDGGLLSTIPGKTYGKLQGTSMATPFATGAMALLKSYHPDWTNDQLLAQFLFTADNIDAKNPSMINKLGTGRINAYRELTVQNPQPVRKLRLEFVGYDFTDANNNRAIEPGETANIGVKIRNYAPLINSTNVGFYITSSDPDVVPSNFVYYGNINPDGYTTIDPVFPIRISQNTSTKQVTLTLHISPSDGSTVTYGSSMQFEMTINAGGILVFDGIKNNSNYSGSAIAQFLNKNGFSAFYTDKMPASLVGFSAVFISTGNFGTDVTRLGSYFNSIAEYIQSGGKIYIEGPDVCYDMDDNGRTDLFPMFGLTGYDDGLPTHDFTLLNGQANSFAGGINITGTSQQDFQWIDKYFANNTTGHTLFDEPVYGPVAVQNSNANGSRTVLMSYNIGLFNLAASPNNQYEFIYRVMNFFGFNMPDYIQPIIGWDTKNGHAPLAVQFQDNSIANYSVTTRAWDFNSDGVIDSYLQNPTCTYTIPGNYSVSLTVTTSRSVTTTYSDLIKTFDGQSAVTNSNFDQGIVIPESSVENPLQAFTVESWIKPMGAPFNTYNFIVFHPGYYLYLSTDNALIFSGTLSNGASVDARTAPNAVNFGSWSHVAVSFGTGVLSIYVNGEDKTYYHELPAMGLKSQTLDNTYYIVGNYGNGAYGFNGEIDELRVWNTTRTKEDIMHQMHNKSLTNIPGLLGYYKFNEGSGDNLANSFGTLPEAYSFGSFFDFGWHSTFSLNVHDETVCSGTRSIMLGESFTNTQGGMTPITAVGGSGNYSYFWFPDNGLQNPISATPTDPGFANVKNYYVRVTDNTTGSILTKNFRISAAAPITPKLPLYQFARSGANLNLGSSLTIQNGVAPFTYFWTDKSGWTSTSANPAITPTSSKRYYLTVTDANGCMSSEISMFVFYFPKGGVPVDDDSFAGFENGSLIYTYPNPAVDNLNLYADLVEKNDATVKILNIAGQTVFTMFRPGTQTIDESIDVSSLATGVYLLVIQSGDLTLTKKIVKN